MVARVTGPTPAGGVLEGYYPDPDGFSAAGEAAIGDVLAATPAGGVLTGFYPNPGFSAAGEAAIDARLNIRAHPPVRVAIPSATFNQASAPATVDGVALVLGERALVIDGTTGGIWVYPGVGAAWSRATDADAVGDLVLGSSVMVQEGTRAGQMMVLRESYTPIVTNHPDVMAYTSAFVNIGNPPAIIDGEAMVGQRLLVNQASGASPNGIWVHKGASQIMTRATDADATGELALGDTVRVAGGLTYKDTYWKIVTMPAPPWQTGGASTVHTWAQIQPTPAAWQPGRIAIWASEAAVERRVQNVGLFTALASTPPRIPATVTSVVTSGYSTANIGAARFNHDAAVGATFVTGANEVQHVAITGSPTGGTWTLTFSGSTTTAMAWNIDAAGVQSALEALASIGAGNVAVTGTPDSAGFRVTFQGTLGNKDVAAMTRATAFTGGTAPNVILSTIVVGVVPSPAGIAFLAADGRVFRIDHNGLTPYQMGALGGTTDDGVAINAYFAYLHTTNVGIANWDGKFLTSVAINYGGDAAFSATRHFGDGEFHLTSTTGSTGHALLTFHKLDRPTWRSIRVTGGGSTAWASRGWRIGLRFKTVSGAKVAGHIWAENFLAAGLLVRGDSQIPTNSSLTDYGSLKFSDIGSGWRDGTTLTGLTTNWSNPVRNGISGSSTQTTTINVTTLPPDWMDDFDFGTVGFAPHYIRIREPNGMLRAHQIKSVDRTAGTISVYPWIHSGAVPETTDYILGAGLWELGNDSNLNTFQMFDGIRVGMGYMAGSLYPASGGPFVLHYHGIGIHVGTTASAASVGLDVRGIYMELGVHDFMFAGLSAQGGTYHFAFDTTYSLSMREQRLQWSGYPRNTDNTFSFGGLQGRITFQGRSHEREKLPRQTALSTTLSLDIRRRDFSRVVWADTLAVTMVPLDLDLHRLTGIDSASIAVLGTGANGAPTGTVTFAPPTRAVTEVTLTAGSVDMTAVATEGRPLPFNPEEVGAPVSGTGVPPGATLAYVSYDGTSARLSAPATAGGVVTVNVNWKVNGGTASVAFSGFTGSPLFTVQFDPVAFDCRVVQILGAQGPAGPAGPTGPAGPAADTLAYVVAESHADVSVVNTVAETAVVNLVLPGGTVAVGDLVRLTAHGSILNNSGASVTYLPRFKFGTTTVLTGAALSVPTNSARQVRIITANILIESVTAQRINATMLGGAINSAGAWSPQVAASSVVGVGTAAESTATDKAVQVTMQLGTAAAAAEFTINAASLEVVRKL